jgi:flap endonuclease-1
MGTNIREIVLKKEIGFGELNGKILVVDSYNIIYQFLSSIRQMDGSPLRDSKGNVTSHLSGLFGRTTRLMSYGMKLAFAFDGKPPEMKMGEINRRVELKQVAEERFKIAEKEENLEEMKKYAARTSRLTKEMVEEAKELIGALGCPIIQAPSEGEAQGAFMVKQGDAYAVVSEDYDSLLFGCPRVIKNLTITARKKQKNRLSYDKTEPSIINLGENLREWGITQDQLIVLSILVGTDFNPGGIKGIGQKKALKLVKEYGSDYERLFEELKIDHEIDFEWRKVFDTIKDMPAEKDYWLVWKGINKERVKEILVNRHEFSLERVELTIAKLDADKKTRQQKGLGEFLR